MHRGKSELLAIGADGARGGWLAALAYGSAKNMPRVQLQLVPAFTDLVALRTGHVPVAVDVPMGLRETVGFRPCDTQARALLGRRASTVFAPPSRRLLAAASYADARTLVEQARLHTPDATGLSAQAFGIVPKMREADEYLQENPGAQQWLWECHPELSFRALAEGRVLRDKKSVGGQAERLALLIQRFPSTLDTAVTFAPGSRQADMTDALDALVALDTALRVRAGDYQELGAQTDATGLVMRIVF